MKEINDIFDVLTSALNQREMELQDLPEYNAYTSGNIKLRRDDIEKLKKIIQSSEINSLNASGILKDEKMRLTEFCKILD